MIRENDPCDEVPVHIARVAWAGLQSCGCPRLPAECQCVTHYRRYHCALGGDGIGCGREVPRSLALDELDAVQR